MTEPLPLDKWSADLQRARQLAFAFAADVREQFNTRVRGLILYGSVVRGEWTPESDVDVLVLLDRVESRDMDWIVNRATSLGLIEQGILLQPLVLPKSEFERLKRQERRFAMEVERAGESL